MRLGRLLLLTICDFLWGRSLSSAARDGRAASAAVSTAARGRVCGWEKVREPPVVPGRLEIDHGREVVTVFAAGPWNCSC